LIILIVVGGCSDSTAQPTVTPTPPLEIEQASRGTPSIRVEQVTATPIPVPTDKEVEAESTVTRRAFENGLPLAARVNDQPLFLETYEQQLARFERALRTQGVDITDREGQARLNHIRQQVLEGLLEQLIIEQQADKLGITVTEEEVDTRIQEAIIQLEGQEHFEVWLADNNLTNQDFIVSLRSQLIAKRLFEHITRDLPDTAEQIQLRVIRVEDRDMAQSFIEQLRNGESFATLAKAYSLDEVGRANAGNLGWFPKNVGVVPPQVEEIAFSLQPGEVSGPIQTPLGFYTIKLENKEAKRSLTNRMLFILKKQTFDDWLMELRSSTKIERYIAL
jgi:parvulin-like peptidyl-prolyl isomerase